MDNAGVTTGDICIGLILSRILQRDILPDHGGNYWYEQEDKLRFVAFLKTSAAANLYDSLSKPFDPDGLSMDTVSNSEGYSGGFLI